MPKQKANSKMKFELLKTQTLYPVLDHLSQEFISALIPKYQLTFQELRQLAEIARDLEMWQAEPLKQLWQKYESEIPSKLAGSQRKEALLAKLHAQMDAFRRQEKVYSGKSLCSNKENLPDVSVVQSGKAIFGDCPVSSPKTLCCQLKTIDAVMNCPFECSYCTIHAFYDGKIIFDGQLRDKLKKTKLAPNRFYHIGSGQSSDSLVWGNQNGLLDVLCEFAADHPNILLELKTKSKNISYFLEHETPRNVVCSWTLNTAAIIRNEEHGTASLDERLIAAQQIAGRGIKVGFHFHPLVYYKGWDLEYPEIAGRLQAMFQPEEVVFITFGTVTLIKPVVQEIRKRGGQTKILQMEMVPDPHGKLTYSDEVKIRMFKTVHEAFHGWHKKVYMYLCMEHPKFWDAVFGRHYEDNDEFERDFGSETMKKLSSE